MTSAGWDRVELTGRCQKLGSGSTPRGGDSVYVDKGTALIRSQNVYNGEFAYEGLAFLGDSEADALRGVTVHAGDVLLNITGDSVARCCLAPEAVLPARVNQHVAIIRPRPDEFIARFLAYYLISPFMQETMLSMASGGGTRKALTKDMIERFVVPKPPLCRQDRIVATLGGYDDLIDNNRRRIKLLEDSVRLLFDEWFVRLRFPGSRTAPKSRELPSGWRREALGRLTSKIGSGATPRGGEAAYVEDGIALIRSQNVYDYQFVDDGLAFIDQDQAARLDGVTVEQGDLLLNITGASVGRCCMVPPRLVPARVNQHVMIIRATGNMDPHYLLCAINSDERKRQLLSYAQTGSTREALTKDLMSAFEVVVPDASTLAGFGELAGDAFRQREVLAALCIKLRTARDLLLPRLMSGELTV